MKKSKNHIERLFSNNKFVLILSLVIAVALWMTVSPERNNAIAVSVNIDTKNSSADTLGLEIVEGQGQKVNVGVEGKWYVISELDENDIKVTYSLGDITKSGEYEIVLSAAKSNSGADFSVTGVTPEKIKVNFDYIHTRDFTIKALAPNINAEKGLVADTPVVASDNSTIIITGPLSVIENIDSVVAEVDKSETINTATSYPTKLKVLDKNAKEIDQSKLTMPFSTVDVTVPINKSKTVALTVAFKNRPIGFNPSYALSDESVTIVGSPDIVNDLNELSIGTIDFSELNESHNSFVFDLTLPSGVNLVDDIDKVTVTVDTTGIATKAFDISTFKGINNKSKLSVSVVTTKKSVYVVGETTLVKALNANDLYLEYDLSTLTKASGEMIVDAFVRSVSGDVVWGYGSYTVQIKVNS